MSFRPAPRAGDAGQILPFRQPSATLAIVTDICMSEHDTTLDLLRCERIYVETPALTGHAESPRPTPWPTVWT
jgi:hypothetical protein